MTNSVIFPFFAIVIAIISLQFGAACAKQLFPLTGAIGITALRLMIATGILMAIWRPWRERLLFSQFKAVCFYGITLGFMNLSFYLAIERIPLGLAVALEFSGPLVLALCSSKRRIDFLWAGLATVGIILISPIATDAPIDIIGVCFALLAAVFWGLYIVAGQRAALIMHEGYATSYGMAMATVFITPIVFFADGYASITIDILPWAFLVALLSSAIPYSLEMMALRRLPKLSFGILMSLEPAVASLTGLVILHEELNKQQGFAIVCIILASLGITFASAKTKPSFS